MPKVSTSYLICATPRSGSTLLCDCLKLTKLAGNPNEWMLPASHYQAERWFGVGTPFDDPDYLSEIVGKTSTPNGMFGAKLMWPTMETFRLGELWNFVFAGPALRNSPVLPNVRYIRISRRDKLRQAISFLIAHKTDFWHKLSPDEEAGPRWPLAALQAELGDPAGRTALLIEIDRCLGEIRWQDRGWEQFFRDEGIVPFDLDYETLVSDLDGTTYRVLDFLGLLPAGPRDSTRTNMLPLSDERNELLVAAYRDYASSRLPLDPGAGAAGGKTLIE
jgi:LPS sulfotransferase NodH